MRILFLYLIVFACGLPAVPAWGRDIFVNNAIGNDQLAGLRANDSGGRGGPVKTLSRALQLADAGDVIILANTGRPYRESVSLVGSRHSGLEQRPFVIRGNGAVLDGRETMAADAWRHYKDNIFVYVPPRMGYQMLFLNDQPASRVTVEPGVNVVPPLKPGQWASLGGKIYFGVAAEKLPSDYRLSYASGQTGMTLFHVKNVIIASLVIRGFQVDGVNLFNSADDVTLANVTCRENGRSGITVGGASTVKITDSQSAANGAAQLTTLPYSESHLINTQLISNTAPGLVDHGGRTYINGVRVEGKLPASRTKTRSLSSGEAS